MMNAKVLLLQLNIDMHDTAIYVNHGIASIAGTLRAAGFAPEIIVLDTKAYHSGRWLERAAEKGYIFAGISVYSNQWEYAIKAARSLKKECDLPVIGGGPHCILFPEALANTDAFSAFVVGEGEGVITTIANRAFEKEPFHCIQGVWTRSADGEIIPAGATQTPDKLDFLAEPAYDLYSREVVLNYPGLMFSRGCPYNCSYCCNAAYRKRLGLFKTRFLSPEKAARRSKEYVKRFQPEYLNFDDDTFTKDPQWMTSFLKSYRSSVGLPFHCNARPETITLEICRILKDSGCDSVSLGCESGSEKLRRTVLNRKMSNDSIIRAADCIRNAGLNLATFNMVGIPNERWCDYLKTVTLNRRLSPSKVQMTVYYPFRGTALGDLCFERGFVSKNSSAASYFAGSVLRLPEFPAWQIRTAQRLFKFLVFITVAPKKAFFELAKDMVKSLPFGHRLIRPWLRLKRIYSNISNKEST